ncbi:MAG: class I SAM-dependent methyltransferase [Candidatus Nanoarchaeia archaeon]
MKSSTIINYFSQYDKVKGNIVADTQKGIFGTSNLECVDTFFKKIQLSADDVFVDLGSGDGRVVLLASSYCNAIGIEIDSKLVQESNTHARKLQREAVFFCQDYETYDFSTTNILFSFADHFFTPAFIEKLKKEFTGTLYIYQGIFLPQELYKGPTIWAGQARIISYKFPNIKEK